MATKTINICDRCKKEEITNYGRPDGWNDINLKAGSWGKDYTLCQECLQSLGVLVPERKDLFQPVYTIKDKLFDVIQEIVQENMQ